MQNSCQSNWAGLNVKEDQINVAIISGLSHGDEMERRTLDCEANMIRQKIELVADHIFERLQGEKYEVAS